MDNYKMKDSIRKIVIVQDKDSQVRTALQFSYLRAFRSLGYECETVGFNINLRLYRILAIGAPWLLNQYLRVSQEQIIRKISNSNCDLALVVKGFYLLPETVRAIQKTGIIVACFNPDDPYSTDFANSSKAIRACINQYDAYFIWDKTLVSKLTEEGCKATFYLPFAADIDIMHPIVTGEIKDGTYRCDVSFIGNPGSERISFLVDLGKLMEGGDTTNILYGHKWGSIPAFNSAQSLNGDAYIKAMQLSKININILRNQNKRAHNMRTFEIPAVGGFMLHEYSTEAASFFKEGQEAEFFRSPEECAEKIKYYSENTEERKRIAAAGFARIQSSGYTYENVMEKLLEELRTIV